MKTQVLLLLQAVIYIYFDLRSRENIEVWREKHEVTVRSELQKQKDAQEAIDFGRSVKPVIQCFVADCHHWKNHCRIWD